MFSSSKFWFEGCLRALPHDQIFSSCNTLLRQCHPSLGNSPTWCRPLFRNWTILSNISRLGFNAVYTTALLNLDYSFNLNILQVFLHNSAGSMSGPLYTSGSRGQFTIAYPYYCKPPHPIYCTLPLFDFNWQSSKALTLDIIRNICYFYFKFCLNFACQLH